MTTTNTTASTANKLTVNKLKAWAKANREIAMTALKARAFAEVERERVDAYIAPIFARYGFTNDLDGSGEVLTNPKKLYLSNDEKRCAAYYSECDAAHRERGYTGEAGTCPALVAEHLQIQAENILLDSFSKFIGVDGFYTLDMRSKALDLAIGSCCAKR